MYNFFLKKSIDFINFIQFLLFLFPIILEIVLLFLLSYILFRKVLFLLNLIPVLVYYFYHLRKILSFLSILLFLLLVNQLYLRSIFVVEVHLVCTRADTRPVPTPSSNVPILFATIFTSSSSLILILPSIKTTLSSISKLADF